MQFMPAGFPIYFSIFPSRAFPWFEGRKILMCGHGVQDGRVRELLRIQYNA